MKPFSRGWPGRCRPSSPTAPIQSRGTGSARPSPEELKSQFDRWLGRKLVVHYSSDLNPIEKVFAKLKGSRLSRQGNAQTQEARALPGQRILRFSSSRSMTTLATTRPE